MNKTQLSQIYPRAVAAYYLSLGLTLDEIDECVNCEQDYKGVLSHTLKRELLAGRGDLEKPTEADLLGFEVDEVQEMLQTAAQGRQRAEWRANNEKWVRELVLEILAEKQ